MNVRRLLLVTVFALAPLWPAAVSVADPLEELAVKTATTAEDHAALASYFRSKADAAQKEAALHRSMAKTYSGSKMTERARMQEHCKQLASSEDALAKQYGEMAAMHDAEAKK